jgi:hypothetical protein
VKAGFMRNKLHKLIASTLLAGVAAVLLAPSAEARREPTPTTTTTEPSYVPPQYGQNPHPGPGPETNPYAPGDTPVIVPVELSGALPVVTDPGAGDAGDGGRLAPAPTDSVLAGEATRPRVDAPSKHSGLLSRTGAETMPLARAGLAALALGAGLVVLARRRSEVIAA